MDINPRNDLPFIDETQRDRRINSEKKLIEYIRKMLGEPIIKVDVTDEQIRYAIDDAFRKFSEWVIDGQDRWLVILPVQEDIQNYRLDERIKAIRGISTVAGFTNSSQYGGSTITLGAFGTIPVGYIPYIYPDGTGMSRLERTGETGNFEVPGVAGSVSGIGTGMGNAVQTAWAYMTNAQAMQNLFQPNMEYHYNTGQHILRIFEKVSGNIAIDAEIEYIPNPQYDDNYGHPWIKDYALNLVKKTWGNNVGKYDATVIGGARINYDRIISEAESELQRLNEELIDRWTEPMGIFSA